MHCYPDYYKNFRCIASRCKHNCCIGWEIDIDADTLDFYLNATGDMGKRLKDSICCDDTPHFILDENERCPFLNDKNLCDIICEYSQEHLCDICAQHPRFHNNLPDRIESGLGLCCEEAARIILGKKGSAHLICEGEGECSDEIITMRDEIIKLLQNREKPVTERISDMLSFCDAVPKKRSVPEFCDVLLSLERMDDKWSELLKATKRTYPKTNLTAFDSYMSEREYEYEQFCVYLVYRHFANSPDIAEAQKRACFVFAAHHLLHAIGAVLYSTAGIFDFDTQVEIARLFSSEIEYSDENLYILFDIV